MKKIVGLVALVLVSSGCAAEADDPTPSLQGSWLYLAPDGASGFGLTIRGNEYAAVELVLTSTKSGDAQVEVGTFDDDGKTIVTHPRQDTCGGSSRSDRLSYTLKGGSLSLLDSEGAIGLTRNGSAPADQFVLRLGCFESGKFVSSPLVDVK